MTGDFKRRHDLEVLARGDGVDDDGGKKGKAKGKGKGKKK
jgi:hypothetical protein